MAKLILGDVDYLSKIRQSNEEKDFTSNEIEKMKSYYANAIKRNAMEVSSVLTIGREAASKIFVR